MSNYINALVNNQKFYILPICNLPDNPSTPDVSDETWVEWSSRGFATATSTPNLLHQYNDNFSAYIIPDYIKNLDIDFISFSVTPNSHVTNPLRNESYSLTCNLVYQLEDGINPFYDGVGTPFTFVDASLYRTQIKVPNGELMAIDFKSLYSIEDIYYGEAETSPAPTRSPDKNNKARPYNITLWKKFISSSSTNKSSFCVDDKLPAGLNAYLNPDYEG